MIRTSKISFLGAILLSASGLVANSYDLYSGEESLEHVQEILDQSVKKTIHSPEWQRKIAARKKSEFISLMKGLAPVMVSVALIIAGIKVDDEGLTILSLGTGLITSPITVPVALWHIEDYRDDGLTIQDECELEIQKMFDLRQANCQKEAQQLLRNLEQRKERIDAMGSDIGKHAAAVIGMKVSSLNAARRERLAKGPEELWKDYNCHPREYDAKRLIARAIEKNKITELTEQAL